LIAFKVSFKTTRADTPTESKCGPTTIRRPPARNTRRHSVSARSGLGTCSKTAYIATASNVAGREAAEHRPTHKGWTHRAFGLPGGGHVELSHEHHDLLLEAAKCSNRSRTRHLRFWPQAWSNA